MGTLVSEFSIDIFSDDGSSTDSSTVSSGSPPAVSSPDIVLRSHKAYEIKTRGLWYKPSSAPEVPSVGRLWRRSKEKTRPHGYILRDVSCEAIPGEVLAIAGPSGAGKSTLIEVLAGRTKPSGQAGSVLVNGQPMERKQFRRTSGYVTQDDALFPFLTVRETLLYSARLRLPKTLSASDKLKRVELVMGELGLMHVAGSRVGSEEVRGLSGGERRRVSIGIDVLHDPAVLLLDEPTSGLDSASALHVTAMLGAMAKEHQRTIVLSIHQPSFRILQTIDKILLLANGSVVHHGSLENLRDALYALGHVIPPEINALEYAIDTIDLIHTDPPEPEPKPEHLVNLPTIHDSISPSSSPKHMDNHTYSYSNSCTKEITILARRFSKNIMRSRQLCFARTVQSLGMSVILGTIFLRVGVDNQGLQERLGFLAFTLTFLLSSTTEGLPIFLQERQIMTRETSCGAYRVFSYVAANTLVFLPFLFVIAMLYAIPVYWLVGLSPSWSAFAFFLLVVWLIVLMANSFVAFFAALVPNYIMGYSLIASSMSGLFLFSGYFIARDNIPKYWLPMHYISLFKYPFEALLVNEFEGLANSCFEHLGTSEGPCILTGHGFLEQQGLALSGKWLNVGVMVIFVIMYRVLCYVILCVKVSRTRR